MGLSSIVCFVLCFSFSFFSLSVLGTSCHCPQMSFFHILFESCLFSMELNSVCPVAAHFDCAQFFAVINKASLNEYPCA